MLFLLAGFLAEGKPIMVPSITPRMIGGKPYTEVTREGIDRYVEDFGEAARRIAETGADAIELHANHGCLVSTFISPLTNKRTDEYGGNPENRMRFALKIVKRMREKVGREFPLSVRIDGSDGVDGGITLDEVISQAKAFEATGADAINVAGGFEYWSSLSIPCFLYPDGPVVPYAEAVKKAVKVPVIVAGKIAPDFADRLLRAGKVDFIAMGRPLLADPELPNKLREGRMDNIRWCLHCGNCLRYGPGIFSCSVNPFLFRETQCPPPPAAKPKKVMVVGGGVAGMQAAAILAERGHKVSLYEKGDHLGGQMQIGAALPGKRNYMGFVEHLERLLGSLGVSTETGTEITKDKVKKEKPDTVVLATGAVPLRLKVPGATGPKVVQANDLILQGADAAKGKVVVVGGGLLGMEVAVWLTDEGSAVSLVSDIGLGGRKGVEEHFVYNALLNRLVDLRIPLYLHSPVVEITESSVIMDMAGEVVALPADTVVLAVGARPVNGLAKELEGIVPEIHVIGDCSEPRSISAATFEAAQEALKI